MNPNLELMARVCSCQNVDGQVPASAGAPMQTSSVVAQVRCVTLCGARFSITIVSLIMEKQQPINHLEHGLGARVCA